MRKLPALITQLVALGSAPYAPGCLGRRVTSWGTERNRVESSPTRFDPHLKLSEPVMRFRLCAVFALCSVALTAQDLKYRVSLRLTAHDELKDVLQSALEHKLRGLKDVALVGKDPQFILRVVGIQTGAHQGSKFRLILAYSFTTVYEDDLAPLFDPKKLPPEAARNVADLVKTLEQHQGAGVVTASMKGIEQACADVVIAFDSVVLDYNRRAVREVNRTNNGIGK